MKDDLTIYERTYLIKECKKHGGCVYYRDGSWKPGVKCRKCVIIPVNEYKELKKKFNELNSKYINLKYKYEPTIIN